MQINRALKIMIPFLIVYTVLSVLVVLYRVDYMSEEEFTQEIKNDSIKCDSIIKVFKDSVAKAEGNYVLGPFTWDITKQQFDSIIDSTYNKHKNGFYLNDIPIKIQKDSCVFLMNRLRKLYITFKEKDYDNVHDVIEKKYNYEFTIKTLLGHEKHWVNGNYHYENGDEYNLPHKVIDIRDNHIVFLHPSYISYLDSCERRKQESIIKARKEREWKKRILIDSLNKVKQRKRDSLESRKVKISI